MKRGRRMSQGASHRKVRNVQSLLRTEVYKQILIASEQKGNRIGCVGDKSQRIKIIRWLLKKMSSADWKQRSFFIAALLKAMQTKWYLAHPPNYKSFISFLEIWNILKLEIREGEL